MCLWIGVCHGCHLSTPDGSALAHPGANLAPELMQSGRGDSRRRATGGSGLMRVHDAYWGTVPSAVPLGARQHDRRGSNREARSVPRCALMAVHRSRSCRPPPWKPKRYATRVVSQDKQLEGRPSAATWGW